MARLTYDAVLLLARLSPNEEVTITEIAIRVFNGYNPANPQQPTKGALSRAMRAAQNIVAMRRATPLPNRRDMASVRVIDSTGGSLQAQFLMNLVVRGGEDRRKGERRADPQDDSGDRRASDRRTQPDGRAAPPRIMRSPPRPPAPPPSPFDIKKDFKL